MGSLQAREFAEMSKEGGDAELRQALSWHLQSNHYPPVPLSMVQPCIDAIKAVREEDDVDAEITLPEGITYNNDPTAPAWAIIEQHHLDSWIEREEY